MEREHTDEHTLEDCFNYFWQLLNAKLLPAIINFYWWVVVLVVVVLIPLLMFRSHK